MGEQTLRSVYFLGIGGIGMSALARYYVQMGVRVAGYDKTPTTLTSQLIDEGMKIHFTEDPSAIPDDVDLVVWTPAVPRDHSEYRYFAERGIPVMKRAEVLGAIASPCTTIAVGGTHGKTTTTTMIAHIFRTAGRPMMAFLGGISKNYGTNFIRSVKERSETSLPRNLATCIVEADEFDRSFLQLSPDIAVITSIDADHLDIYDHTDKLHQSFGDFAARIRRNGSLIVKQGVSLVERPLEGVSRFSYALSGPADFAAANRTLSGGLTGFDFVTPEGTLKGFTLGMPGLFNLENAIAALAAGWIAGIPEEDLRRAMHGFTGVVRRFDIRINRTDFVYIDDYAHHPEELHACIWAARELYPGKHLTGVFQPHLYSRTRDLAEDFARVLGELDSLVLLDIYPAREIPLKGINSEWLLKKIPLADKRLCSREGLVDLLAGLRPELLLTLGAGDIDLLVKPITDRFGAL